MESPFGIACHMIDHFLCGDILCGDDDVIFIGDFFSNSFTLLYFNICTCLRQDITYIDKVVN